MASMHLEDTQLAKRLKEIEVELLSIKREKSELLELLQMSEEEALLLLKDPLELSPEEQAYLRAIELQYEQEVKKQQRLPRKQLEELPPWALFCR